MNELELKEKLDEIRQNMRLLDDIIDHDHKKDEWYITERQRDFVNSLMDLFRSLNWQIALNNYKKLEHIESEPIRTKKCGQIVKVSPCNDKYDGKTYFGILIGDVPLQISSSIDEEGTLKIKRSMYNPAIFVPELNEIIYGCGSWWGRIESEEELKDVITEDTINNVWYVKMLQELVSKKTEKRINESI